MSRETATRAAMAWSRLYGGPMASVKQIQVTRHHRSTSPDRAEVMVEVRRLRHRSGDRSFD